MRKILIFIIFHLFFMVSEGQDLNITQYPFYRDGLNPASFIQNNDINVFVLYNNEFSSFVTQPNTQLIDVSLNLKGHKLGLLITNDVIGYDKTQNLKFRFAKQFRINSKSLFSLGLSAGAIHKKIEATKLTFEVKDDPVSFYDYRYTDLDFDFGAEFQSEKFFIGISAIHLSKNLSEFRNISPVSHYYAYGQYSIASNNAFRFYPNVLLRGWKNTFWGEAGLIVFYKNLAWIGSTYSIHHDLTFSAGLRIKKNLLFGYAFKSNMNARILKPLGTNTHEVFLNFAFNYKNYILKTPRFID